MNQRRWINAVLPTTIVGTVLALPVVECARAQDDTDGTIHMQDVLLIPPVGVARRSAIHTDAIEKLIVQNTWQTPSAGDTVKRPDGSTDTWKTRKADENGWIGHRGYVLWNVHVQTDRIMMLDASGHSLVYVNGEPSAGDPYQYGNLSLPVALHAGDNEFLFRVSRGRIRAQLSQPKADVFFDLRDATLPDVVRGAPGQPKSTTLNAGVVIVNAARKAFHGSIVATDEHGESLTTDIGPVPPCSLRKVAIDLARSAPLVDQNKVTYHLSVQSSQTLGSSHPTDRADLNLNVRNTSDNHVRTFVSDIDGSVQLYSVRPSTSAAEGQALFLTLHGAGVQAPGQSGSYGAKDWGTIIAPTNRRKFGFDWEDWGRLDAMEVLHDAMRLDKPDPNRIYLTGHSMGGHGTWQVGVQFPDRFAAIGPSAAWVSFWSYAGAGVFDDASPVGAIMKRATLPSDTLALSRNYLQYGIYILHGNKDDNVPVEQARTMRKHLAGYHSDFAYYERPGAGHWWGSACVDWGPMFDFFSNHTRPEPASVRHIEFVTANPSISSRSQWVTIQQQSESLVKSAVVLDFDPGKPSVRGTTTNVRRLAIDVEMLSGSLDAELEKTTLSVSLDGNDIECPLADATDGRLFFKRDGHQWQQSTTPIPMNEKRPQRAGPFKEAFKQRFVLVYGTRGTPDEQAWALAKARYDAQTFLYRGNGSVDVIPDVDFLQSEFIGRCLVLYGNADTNRVWSDVLKDCPVQVTNGAVVVGDRSIAGKDLGCLFTYPSATDPTALIAAVGGTGVVGMRVTDRLPYFVSGVHYPDWFIARPDMLTRGIDGVVGAGFFDQQWQVDEQSSGWAK